MSSLGHCPEDIFRGFHEEDVERIARLVDPVAPASPEFFTDALGVRVESGYCPWIGDRLGLRSTEIPLPSDGYLAPGIEYAGLALALELARPEAGFTVAEIGAGWGPWLSAAAVAARRLGYAPIRLIGMEASPSRFDVLRRHLAINDLVPADAQVRGEQGTISWRLERAAVHTRDGTLYWPAADVPLDAGMAAIETAHAKKDYRGNKVETVPVRALSLTSLLDDTAHVDFMHVDIQGSEWDIISNGLDILSKKVRTLFIGTHSRKIEGDLIDLMRRSGWRLFREKPCQFYSMAEAEHLTALTYHDGAQFWVKQQQGRNPQIAKARSMVKRMLGR